MAENIYPVLRQSGMDADRIEELSDRYDAYIQTELSGETGLSTVEENLRTELQEQEYVTQDQLAQILRWKLVNQGGRAERYVQKMRNVPDKFVQHVTTAAFAVDEPQLQIETIAAIPGVGPATASAALAFYNPEDRAVGDRYLMDALLDEDRQLRASDYPDLLSALEEQNPKEFDLRTVEKACYRQYQERHDIA